MKFYGVFGWDSDNQGYYYWEDNAFETEEAANRWVEAKTKAAIDSFAEWRKKYPNAYGPSLEDQAERINDSYEVRLVEVKS